MTTFNLTEKETIALIALTQSCLDGMGGSRPSDLEYDEFTWIDLNDLIDNSDFNRHEAAGLFSSLMEKGVIEEYDSKCSILATDAWKYCDTIWSK